MRKYWDKLELTYKSVRIRNIQRILNIVQGILIIVLSIVILWLSGLSFKPFYFPLDFLFFFLMVMLLVYSIEAIAFRLLMIGYSKSPSATHLMAKNSLKTAFALLIISIVILAVPFLVTFAQGELSKSDSGIMVSPSQPYSLNFTNKDRLAFSKVEGITVNAIGGSVNVWIMTESDFADVNVFGCPPSGDVCPTSIGSTIHLSSNIFRKSYEEYVMYITSAGNREVSYVVDAELSTFIISYIPILALISIIAQGIWIGYLLPIIKKYAPMSIYSRKYVHGKPTIQSTEYKPRPEKPAPRVRFETVTPTKAPEIGHAEHEEVAIESMDIDSTLVQARMDFNQGNYELALKAFEMVLTAETAKPRCSSS
jgi:hypothetical protein